VESPPGRGRPPGHAPDDGQPSDSTPLAAGLPRRTEIRNVDARVAEVTRDAGMNHNLARDDFRRFFGTVEVPTQISETRIFHDFSMGAFSYVMGGFLYGTHIGRYCSLSNGLHIGQGDHPLGWLSSHPFQYQKLKLSGAPRLLDRRLYLADVEATREELIEAVPKPRRTTIGHDVWIGHGVSVVNGVTIGTGCAIGLGAVVTKDLEPYSVAVGVPARVIRKRFDEASIERLLRTQWWHYAPWQLRHVEFNRIERALDQIEQLRESGADEYVPQVVEIVR